MDMMPEKDKPNHTPEEQRSPDTNTPPSKKQKTTKCTKKTTKSPHLPTRSSKKMTNKTHEARHHQKMMTMQPYGGAESAREDDTTQPCGGAESDMGDDDETNDRELNVTCTIASVQQYGRAE